MSEPDIRHATVTVRRAKDFYGLLCDLGFDDAIDESEAARESAVKGRPVGIAEQAAHDAGETETQTVKINTNQFMNLLMREGKLDELAAIVLDIPDDVAVGEVPIETVSEGVAVFIVAYVKLMSQLVGTAGATTSA